MNNDNEIKKVQRKELEMLIEVDRVCRKNGLTYYLAYGSVLGAIRHKGFIPWDSDIDIIVVTENYNKFCEILQKELTDKYCINSTKTDSTYELLFARIGLRDKKHHRIHIDIFPLAGAPKSRLGRKIFSKIAYLNYKCFYAKKISVNNKYINRKKLAIVAKIILLPFPSKLFIWIFNRLSTMFPVKEADILCNICGSYGYKELIPKSYFGNPVYMDFEGYKFPVPKEWDKYLRHIYGDYMIPKKDNYIK